MEADAGGGPRDCNAAIVARELDIPMISGVDLPEIEDGTAVTLDGERGVLYAAPDE